jgi:hypothetical protein
MVRHGTSWRRLPEADVRAIFLSMLTARELAAKYAISSVAVHCIWRRATWKEITEGLSRPSKSISAQLAAANHVDVNSPRSAVRIVDASAHLTLRLSDLIPSPANPPENQNGDSGAAPISNDSEETQS